MANGTRASYTYDVADQLLRLVNLKADSTTMSSFAYLYDLPGNRTRVIESSGDRVTWTYDNLYQLARELRSGVNSYPVTYTYDLAGNRLTKRDSGSPTTYSYDAANQLLTQQDSTGRTTYAYDADGDLAKATAPAGGITTYSWDFEKRLTKVLLSTRTRNTFSY